MKPIGRGFDSLEEGLAITAMFGLTSLVLTRDAYDSLDNCIMINALVSLVGTYLFAYNTLVIGTYTDFNDYY